MDGRQETSRSDMGTLAGCRLGPACPDRRNVREDLRRLGAELAAEPLRWHAVRPFELGREMALVAEPQCLGDVRQRRLAREHLLRAHQSLSHEIAVGRFADGPLEQPREMPGAQPGHVGQRRERKIVEQMRMEMLQHAAEEFRQDLESPLEPDRVGDRNLASVLLAPIRDNPDERVQGALSDLLESLRW